MFWRENTGKKRKKMQSSCTQDTWKQILHLWRASSTLGVPAFRAFIMEYAPHPTCILGHEKNTVLGLTSLSLARSLSMHLYCETLPCYCKILVWKDPSLSLVTLPLPPTSLPFSKESSALQNHSGSKNHPVLQNRTASAILFLRALHSSLHLISGPGCEVN